MTELYRTDNVAAQVTAAGDQVLVISITFKPKPDFDAPGLLAAAAQAHGFTALDILCVRKFPFPRHEVLGAIAAAHAFAKPFRRVAIYGSSLGGYAALNFAPLLGAKVAIAASPLFSPDPAKVPFEQRWAKERTSLPAFPFDNMVQGLAGLDHVWLMYDPYDLDDSHTQAILDAAPSATPLPIRFTGHPVSRFLAQAGLLDQVIADVAHDSFDPARFHAAVRAGRLRSPRYYQGLADAQPLYRDALRVRLLEEGIRLIRKRTAPFFLRLIPPLLRLGRRIEAKTAATAARKAGADPELVKALMKHGAPYPPLPKAQPENGDQPKGNGSKTGGGKSR